MPYQALKMSDGSISEDTMALIARSKLPAFASSNHTDVCTTRRFDSMLRCSFSMAWMATDHSLKLAMSRTTKSSPLRPPA